MSKKEQSLDELLASDSMESVTFTRKQLIAFRARAVAEGWAQAAVEKAGGLSLPAPHQIVFIGSGGSRETHYLTQPVAPDQVDRIVSCELKPEDLEGWVCGTVSHERICSITPPRLAAADAGGLLDEATVQRLAELHFYQEDAPTMDVRLRRFALAVVAHDRARPTAAMAGDLSDGRTMYQEFCASQPDIKIPAWLDLTDIGRAYWNARAEVARPANVETRTYTREEVQQWRDDIAHAAADLVERAAPGFGDGDWSWLVDGIRSFAKNSNTRADADRTAAMGAAGLPDDATTQRLAELHFYQEDAATMDIRLRRFALAVIAHDRQRPTASGAGDHVPGPNGKGYRPPCCDQGIEGSVCCDGGCAANIELAEIARDRAAANGAGGQA